MAAVYQPFVVESRGLEPIPPEDRPLTPRSLGFLWLGASFNIEYVVWGALVASFGLSFLQSLVVIIGGNLCWLMTGLCSLQGPRAGTTSFGVSSFVFGRRPNQVLAGINWLTQVGFETVGLVLVALSLIALAREVGIDENDVSKVVAVALAALLQMALPYFGHATLASVLKRSTGLFALSFFALGLLAAPKVHLSATWSGASWETITLALVVVLSAGGMGWCENASDYSRYLSRKTSSARIVVAVACGGGLPVIATELMGAAIATALRNPASASVVSGLPGVFPAWFTVPYLLIALLQLLAINGLDLYSSGVSLQAAGAPLKRSQCVIVDTLICAGLSGFAIFSSEFTLLLDDFAAFIMVWIAPWIGVYLADWFSRRGRYDEVDIPRARWRAVLAQLCGMATALMWIDTGPFVGPLSRIAHGADLSIPSGLVAAAGVSLLASRLFSGSSAAEAGGNVIR